MEKVETTWDLFNIPRIPASLGSAWRPRAECRTRGIKWSERTTNPALSTGLLPPSYDQRYIVALLVRAEGPHIGDQRRHDRIRSELPMTAQRFDEPLFAVLFQHMVHRLRDAICIERKQITRPQRR